MSELSEGPKAKPAKWKKTKQDRGERGEEERVEGRNKQWEVQPVEEGALDSDSLILTVVMLHPLLLLYTLKNNY